MFEVLKISSWKFPQKAKAATQCLQLQAEFYADINWLKNSSVSSLLFSKTVHIKTGGQKLLDSLH